MLALNIVIASILAIASAQHISPKILSPQAGDIWYGGDLQKVVWDNSCTDCGSAAQTATIKLGWLDSQSEGEHLYIELVKKVYLYPPHPNFVTFEVPLGLVERDSYIVALIGDSGNISPEFTLLANRNSTEAVGGGKKRSAVTFSKAIV